MALLINRPFIILGVSDMAIALERFIRLDFLIKYRKKIKKKF